MNNTLEHEFEIYKMLHKYEVLKSRIKKYYEDLEVNEINIPNFMRKNSPEILARIELNRIMNIDDKGETFNRLYEMGWKDMVNILP